MDPRRDTITSPFVIKWFIDTMILFSFDIDAPEDFATSL